MCFFGLLGKARAVRYLKYGIVDDLCNSVVSFMFVYGRLLNEIRSTLAIRGSMDVFYVAM